MTTEGALTGAPRSRDDHARGPEPKIFISYRKDLSRGPALHLYEKLSEHFPDQVFRDTDSLAAGSTWAEELNRTLTHPALRVVVCIVAADFWSHPSPGTSTPRLWNEQDWVLRELEIALERRREDGFVLILAPQDGDSRLPSPDEIDAQGIPPRTRALLSGVCDVEIKDRHLMSDRGGLNDLVDSVVEIVSRFDGAQVLSEVKNPRELAAREGRERQRLRAVLERRYAEGGADAALVALSSWLMVLEREYAAARERVRRHVGQSKRFFGSARTPDEAYWHGFIGLVLAASEIGEDRPRRLGGLSLARELANDVLLPSLQGLAACDPAAARVSAGDVAITSYAVAGLLESIVDDYFGTRGISLSPRGATADDELRTSIAEVTDRVRNRPPPRDLHELEPR